MKRWMVLLIVFALMGGWIVLSGCSSTDITISGEDIADCVACAGEGVVGCSDSCVKSCWETCFDCSWINNVECNGDPMQFCFDCGCAFTNSCGENHIENLEQKS